MKRSQFEYRTKSAAKAHEWRIMQRKNRYSFKAIYQTNNYRVVEIVTKTESPRKNRKEVTSNHKCAQGRYRGGGGLYPSIFRADSLDLYFMFWKSISTKKRSSIYEMPQNPCFSLGFWAYLYFDLFYSTRKRNCISALIRVKNKVLLICEKKSLICFSF